MNIWCHDTWLPVLELVYHFESIHHILQIVTVASSEGILEVDTLPVGPLNVAEIIIDRIIIIEVIIQGVALSKSDFLVGLLLALPAGA